MTDETKTPEPNAAAETPQAGNEVARLQIETETLKGQIADLTDRLLRAHADMDNLRKRMDREKEETIKYAITKFARDVVTVADNFQRATDSVPAEAMADNDALKALHDGVSMTEREFVNVLERHGVRRIDPLGEIFNPHQHQAMMEMQTAEVPSGTILQVYQPGYMIEDRVLRPAMVVVAKGGAKAAPANGEPKSKVANDDGPADAA